jgi:NADPH:quinone reductase-like Zn-dependent oxidoreductase
MPFLRARGGIRFAVQPYGPAAFLNQIAEWYREDLNLLMGLLAQGKIRPHIAARLPLADAARAHQMLYASAVSGKLVLVN